MNDLHSAAVALGDEIQRFGSYFGYAAIIGLGVLSLLYFAQAREVKRLREWAGRAPERDAELAQRVQSDAQKRVIAQPIGAPATSTTPASPQTPAAQSADAARMAAAAAVMEKFQPPGTPTSTPTSASATASASAVGPPGSLTRATPASTGAAAATGAAPNASSGTPAPATGAPDQAAAPAPGSVEAANASKSPPFAAPPAPASDPAPSSPVPGMSAGTAGALAAARQSAAPSAYANGSGSQDTHESDAARPEPLPDLPARRPRAAATATDDGRGSSRGRIGAIVAGAVAVLVAGVVLVLVLTGGSEDPPPTNQIGDASPPAAAPPPPPPSSALTKADRAAAPVTVLNGTTQTGLASAVARTIEKDGFTILATETNADQQIAKTTVSYAPGTERAARSIAQIMKVPTSAIRPIDANTSVAASPEAKIVVLVGSDKSGAG